jgi:hypothetical protein
MSEPRKGRVLSRSMAATAPPIHVVREKVILDVDLARLYGVSTKRLNEQVRRNRRRFPADFVFQLTIQEERPLWSPI